MLLTCKGVSKVYHAGKPMAATALNQIDLAISAGEFVSISGPSGSGKTTLLNVIGGLDSVSAGKVVFMDKVWNKIKESEKSRIRLYNIGFVFQAYNLIPVFSAMENIEYILMLQNEGQEERRQRVLELAKYLGIADLLDKKPNQLSGGQQQRVAIARAIVAKPKLILADEPTANLDSKTGESIIQLMKQLNEEAGITFVYTSHEKRVIEQAKRKVVLVDGEVNEDPA